jgi:hypothetical protein
MMAEDFSTSNPIDRSKNSIAINIAPVPNQVPHEAYAHSWLDVTARHNADIRLYDALWQDLNR